MLKEKLKKWKPNKLNIKRRGLSPLFSIYILVTVLLFISSCSEKESNLSNEDKCKIVYKVYSDCFYGSYFIEDPTECEGMSKGFYKILKKEGYGTDIAEKGKSVCYSGCKRSIDKLKLESYKEFKKRFCYF